MHVGRTLCLTELILKPKIPFQFLLATNQITAVCFDFCLKSVANFMLKTKSCCPEVLCHDVYHIPALFFFFAVLVRKTIRRTPDENSLPLAAGAKRDCPLLFLGPGYSTRQYGPISPNATTTGPGAKSHESKLPKTNPVAAQSKTLAGSNVDGPLNPTVQDPPLPHPTVVAPRARLITKITSSLS